MALFELNGYLVGNDQYGHLNVIRKLEDGEKEWLGKMCPPPLPQENVGAVSKLLNFLRKTIADASRQRAVA
ncbi:MAG: hypothetical protein LBB23_03070 [Rickettsiales bacterium]|jgi:hypothetical protein|nr:hypothetical protein [Rickettsiales bacterium]